MYDFILLDCPPSLGLLTINALTAAEELIVPIQCEYYALEGLGQLLRNVSLVQQNINSGLRLSGIVMTMFDPRTKLSEQVVQEVQRYFGDLVYGVIIPRTVRLSEAPGFGQPITVYDPKSKGAEAYRQLAREVALRPPPDAPMPLFEDMPIAVMTPLDEVGDRGVRLTPCRSPSVPKRLASQPSCRVRRLWPRAPSRSRFRPIEPIEVDRSPVEAELPPVEANPPEAIEESPQAAPEPSGRPEVNTEASDEDLWEEPPPEPEPRVKRPSSPAPPGELPRRRVVVIDENRDLNIDAPPEGPPSPPGADEQREGMADIGATLDDEPGRKRRWRIFRKGGD